MVANYLSIYRYVIYDCYLVALHAKPAGVVALHSSAVYDTPISVLSVIVPHHTFPNKFGVIYCIPLVMLGLWLRYLYVC